MSFLTLTTLAQWAGITMPILYAGITFQYSLTMHLLAHTTATSATTSTAHHKLLARQWLALYQQGPRWVPPLVHTGVLANLYLAFTQPPRPRQPHLDHHQQHPQQHQQLQQQHLYLAAAALAFAILPLTFLIFEPGINGACKWKAAALLQQPPQDREDQRDRKEEGEEEKKKKEEEEEKDTLSITTTTTTTATTLSLLPSVRRHSARAAARAWAERADMAELVEVWARLNHVRWVLGLLEGVVSFAALVGGGGGGGGGDRS